MTRFPDGDVQGPVQAEVFVAWLAGDRLELTAFSARAQRDRSNAATRAGSIRCGGSK